MVKLDNSEPQEDLRAQESIPLFLQGQQRPHARQKHLLCGWFVYYYFRSFSASSQRSHRHRETPPLDDFHIHMNNVKMSTRLLFRAVVNERLTAAAEEIFQVFESTIAKYEEEASSSKQEIERLQGLLLESVSTHKTGLSIFYSHSSLIHHFQIRLE